MVKACLNIAKFYAHESCGQCTPCREGTSWLVKFLLDFTMATEPAGDIEMLLEITDNMGGLADFHWAVSVRLSVRSVKQSRGRYEVLWKNLRVNLLPLLRRREL
jgi:NADH:ubiquinone oxidoreductase subunit F (NADH-binding)